MSKYIEDLRLAYACVPNLNILKGKSILVTGAGGLIGTAIVDFLIQLNINKKFDLKVYAGMRDINKFYTRYAHIESQVVFFKYEATDSIQGDIEFDYIIHTASPANPTSYMVRPVETVTANVFGMYNLLQYVKNHNTQRVVYVSSSEVYGKKNDASPYKEDEYGYVDITNPRSCYPSSKRCAETLCASFRKEYGIDYVVVRPGHVYGPTVTENDNRASSQFIKDVAAGKNIVMKSAGNQMRSYCYVVDCVTSILTVLINGESGAAYNISNPNSVCTIREFALCVARVAGKKVCFENPTEQELGSYNLMDNSSLDSSLIQELGWKGIFDLNTGVAHSVEAYKIR